MSVGYEDDSFVVYSILQDYKPLNRGLGHRSFVSEITFDNEYVQRQMELMFNAENLLEPVLERNNSLQSQESGTLSSLLKRQKSQLMKKVDNTKREYRILTGGEDGMICWWNCLV